MHQPDSDSGDQRGLLGRLCKHGIASRQGSAYLADEYCKREIPWTDADHRTERLGLSAGWELAMHLLRVIAAEVDRLTHLGYRIRQRLSGLAHGEPDQCCAV